MSSVQRAPEFFQADLQIMPDVAYPLMSGAQTVYKSSEDRGLNTGGCPLWFGLRLFFGLLIGADNVWKKTGSQGTAVYIRAPRVHDGASCLQIIRPLVSA